MPKETVSIHIKASCNTVFDLVHDYDKRLLWDSMLKEAKILGDFNTAAKGVKTRCVGTWKTFGIAMDTEYISFERGRLAAVKLISKPSFFKSFAATIKHESIDETQSKLIYIYSFQSKPQILSRILDPIMNLLLRREVKARLASLKTFIESQADA